MHISAVAVFGERHGAITGLRVSFLIPAKTLVLLARQIIFSIAVLRRRIWVI